MAHRITGRGGGRNRLRWGRDRRLRRPVLARRPASAGWRWASGPAPEPRENWTVVDVRAAALNHHDLWSLRGVGLRAEQLPMILGTDAAGVTADGREVVVHGVIGGASGHGVGADEPRSLLSERYHGTLAEQVAVPTWNLVDKPAELSFVEAACLPTAWLTAYRMLFRTGRRDPGPAGARAGRRRRAGHGGDPARRGRGARGDRDQPLRGAPGARAGARCRRGGGARDARAAGRRGAGERRQGHLVALGPVGAAGRDHRRRGRHQRGRRTGRADADLLPGDHRRRHDDGVARRPASTCSRSSPGPACDRWSTRRSR